MKKDNGKLIDLSETLASYTSGWVAIDKKNRVVIHTKDFATICKKVKNKKDLFLIPASKNYFGQLGFFDHFKIMFDLPKKQIEIT